jgi:hypothetical protein
MWQIQTLLSIVWSCLESEFGQVHRTGRGFAAAVTPKLAMTLGRGQSGPFAAMRMVLLQARAFLESASL